MTHFFCARCSRLLSEKEVLVEENDDGSCLVLCCFCESGVSEV